LPYGVVKTIRFGDRAGLRLACGTQQILAVARRIGPPERELGRSGLTLGVLASWAGPVPGFKAQVERRFLFENFKYRKMESLIFSFLRVVSVCKLDRNRTKHHILLLLSKKLHFWKS